MNQILATKISKTNNKKIFKIQFIVSIAIIFALIAGISYSIFSIKHNEKLSNNLLGNYNVYQLYSSDSSAEENNVIENTIFGTIEIPKINLYYPIFSELSEENLKVSPCKFYGPSLDDNGNICIAGHNYDNDKFFSKINLLKPDDLIYIYNLSDKKYTYKIYSKYEVKSEDLSPIYEYSNNKELTLITCNNLNGNRFIIKAIQI